MASSRRSILVVLSLLVVVALLFAGFAALYGLTNENPCNTFFDQRTGEVEYEGRTFECWHGEIVGIR